jgi:N-acetylglucosaminyl-diphospho-decaprenol L-rhamnosyltransferase
MPDPRLDEITVVIVTYNSAHCLPQLQTALATFTNVCIIDNGSQDLIESSCQQYAAHARLIRLPKNIGFGGANNKALRDLRTPFALLLNPDCLINIDAVLQLLRTAQALPESALIAPQIVKANGSLEISYRWPSRLWASSGAAAEAMCGVGFATGACWLIRLEHFAKIGFFDERFFLYYEDEDLCQRLFDARKDIVIEPQARVTHLSRSSVKESFPWPSQYIRGYHHAQSKLIFEAKHGNVHNVQSLRFRVLILAILSLPIRLLWPQPQYVVRLIGRISGLLGFKAKLLEHK